MEQYPPHLGTGATSLVIGGDVFGKWVEGAPVAKLDSHHTTVWLHDELVCRYGTPLAICTDRGLEYRGAFFTLLQVSGHIAAVFCHTEPAGKRTG